MELLRDFCSNYRADAKATKNQLVTDSSLAIIQRNDDNVLQTIMRLISILTHQINSRESLVIFKKGKPQNLQYYAGQ